MNSKDKHRELITASNARKKPSCLRMYAVPSTNDHVDRIADSVHLVLSSRVHCTQRQRQRQKQIPITHKMVDFRMVFTHFWLILVGDNRDRRIMDR